MHEFKIKVARIEVVESSTTGDQVRITFQVEGDQTSLKIPVILKMKEFDDTEMVQVARNELHQIFVELAAQTEKWTLSMEDVNQLSGMSLRPKS